MATRRIAVDEIEIITELYPRRRHQDRIVGQYRQALDLLPPVTVVRKDGKYRLVDGYHRLLAHRLENQEQIAAEVIRCDDILLEAIRRNAAHGYQLEDADKRRNAVLLYTREENPLRDEVALAATLQVSERTIRGYLSEVKQEERNERDGRIRELWLDCYSQDEIAEMVGEPIANVNRPLSNLAELPEWKVEPVSLQSWTLWDEWQDCAEQYGADYPGRMPGQIVENLLYLLTEPGDCVFDPMAGSGTTRDVCQAMGRRCFSSDARPFPGKPFIRRHAIDREGSLPDVPGTVKRQGGYQLVLLDPPYWRQADYGRSRDNIGAVKDFAAYMNWLDAILISGLAAVKPRGFVALISSMTMHKGRIAQPAAAWCQTGTQTGAELWDWIIVPYTTQRATGAQIAKAREDKRLLRRHRDLLVFKMS